MIKFNFDSDEIIKEYELKKIRSLYQIRPEQYIKLSNKYDIDIEIDVVDYISGFYQKIEIHKGKLIKNELIDYYFDDCGQKQSLRSDGEETIQESMFLDMWL